MENYPDLQTLGVAITFVFIHTAQNYYSKLISIKKSIFRSLIVNQKDNLSSLGT